MSRVRPAALAGLCLTWAAVARADGPPAGTFASDTIQLDLRPDGPGRYVGQLTVKGRPYPLTARADGTRVRGQFVSNGHPYDFTAEPRPGGVTLTSGGNTFALIAAPANDARPPAGYTLVRSTHAGRALVGRKPGVARVRAALRSALDDLFDPGYTVTAAYEDARDHRLGLAAADARIKGHPVKVRVMARLTGDGAAVAVVFCGVNATPDDWAKLAGNAGGGDAGGGDATLAAAVAAVHLRPYQFPDGTGSVGLPDGYQTDAASCQNGFVVNGPAGQQITLGSSCGVSTPDSTAVRLARQTGVGFPQLVAPWCAPADAVVALVPQFSRLSQQQGQPPVEVDHVRTIAPLRTEIPGGRAAAVAFGVTTADRPGDRPRHYQGFAQVLLAPTSNESYMYWATSARAPDETAARDLPVLIATINSWRTNDQVIQANTAAWIAASNRTFAALQAAHRTVEEGNDDYNRGAEANSRTQARSLDDYDETIRGFTTVEDTTTGERTQVTLGDVDDVVYQLNKFDPGRYVHIPLKDDVDP